MDRDRPDAAKAVGLDLLRACSPAPTRWLKLRRRDCCSAARPPPGCWRPSLGVQN